VSNGPAHTVSDHCLVTDKVDSIVLQTVA